MTGAFADLLPILARHYFSKRLELSGGISAVQSTVLIGVGLQRKTMVRCAWYLQMCLYQIPIPSSIPILSLGLWFDVRSVPLPKPGRRHV